MGYQLTSTKQAAQKGIACHTEADQEEGLAMRLPPLLVRLPLCSMIPPIIGVEGNTAEMMNKL